MTTGELIKSARKSAHITQKKLGEKLGVAYQTVAQWENDLRNPKLDTLQRIAAALDIPVTELMDDWGIIDTEDGDTMTTGEMIKAARRKAGLTQKQLGERLGVSESAIAQHESGQRVPKLDTLQHIAAALGIPVTELIDDWNAIDTEGVVENAGRRVKTMAEQEKGGQGVNTRKPIVLRTRPEESGVGVVRLSRKAQMAVRRLQERSNLPARQIVSEIIIQAEDLVDVDPPDD